MGDSVGFSAYDILRKGVFKSVGRQFGLEWSTMDEKTRSSIRDGWVEKFWCKVFIPKLTSLTIEDEAIRGRLINSVGEEEQDENLVKLHTVRVYSHFWVFTNSILDDSFILRGFSEKKEAIAAMKSDLKTFSVIDSFYYRW